MADKNLLLCRASTTISSIVGNVTGFVKEHISQAFPKGYFKDVYIDTSMGAVQMDEDKNNIFKKGLPLLIIRPEFEASNENSFQYLPLWRRSFEHIYKNPRYNYRRVLFNDEDGYFIYSIPDRVKLTFDIKIRINSYMRQLDLINYIRQTFNTYGYYYVNKVPIESEIPKTFIKIIMDQQGINSENPEELQAFNEYLKRYSNDYIDIKYNLSNGKYMYSYKYGTNILCRFESFDGEGHNRRNMVDEDGMVNIQLSTELWVPCSYILETTKLLTPEDMNPPNIIDYGHSVLNFSIIQRPQKVLDDKTMIFWQGFVSDINTPLDILELDEVLPQQIKDVADYNIDEDIDNSEVFKVKVFRNNGDELIEEKDFKFDWKERKLTLIHPFYNTNHYMAIYGNLKKINETLEKIILGEKLKFK